MENFRDKLLGSIMGLVIGDALGVPVEFSERVELKRNPVNDMRGWGSHNQPPGTWSDDTSLTLCLIDSLCEGYDINDIAKKFVEWYEDGLWTPYGYAFDIGRTTKQAIIRVMNRYSPKDSGGGGEWDNGNGSLMRIAPLIFYTKSLEIDDRMRIVHEVSSITHAHPRTLIACGFYVDYGINILNGFPKEEAYKKTVSFIKNYYSQNNEFYRELKHFHRILDGKVWKLPEDAIESHGYVVHTLEAALWSFIGSSNFKDAVLKAINLGHDTDTLGAITGSLAGIYYGFHSIPQDWIEKIAKKDEIIKLIERFYITLTSSSKR